MEKGAKKAEKKRPDIKKIGKRAAQTGAGAALAVSLFFGGLFASPKDIVGNEASPEPQAIVQTVELPPAPEPEVIPAEVQTQKKKTLRERIAERIRALPLVVRAVFVLPAWAMGYGIIWLFTFLGSLTGIPIVGAIIKWLIGAAVVLALLLLAERLFFPNIPLKKLLSRKNLFALGACAGVISLAGVLGGLLWPEHKYVTALVDIGAVAAYTVFLIVFAHGKQTAEA